MLHTYTVIKKDKSVFNHLSYENAKSIAEEGDLLLTVKDNHVSNIRILEGIDRFYGKEFKSIDNGKITPFYQ
jgi:hypothetical protein